MAQKRSTKRKLVIDLIDTVTSMGLKLVAAVEGAMLTGDLQSSKTPGCIVKLSVER